MNDRRWMRVAADIGEWLTRTRIAVGGALLAAAAAMAFGFWLGRFHPDSDYAAAEKRFSRALSAVERLENEQRKMRRERDANRTRLRLAEKTINSLGEEIERLHADSLERGEELAFYRQVLAEQSNSSAAVAIRGFEINPDFRPDRYRLSAVLARGENRRGEFKGGFELVVTLRRDGRKETLRHPPEGEESTLAFRLYYEIDEPFAAPPGAEIVNAQLVIFTDDGKVIASQELIEEPSAVNGDSVNPSPPLGGE